MEESVPSNEYENMSPQERNSEFQKIISLFPASSSKNPVFIPVNPESELTSPEDQQYEFNTEGVKRNIEGGQLKEVLFAKLNSLSPFMKLTPSGRADLYSLCEMIYFFGIPTEMEGEDLEHRLNKDSGVGGFIAEYLAFEDPQGEGVFGEKSGRAIETTRFEGKKRYIQRKKQHGETVKPEDINKIDRWKKDLYGSNGVKNFIRGIK